MSPPFSPAARTRTSTSPAPATGSGCSSITSSCSRIVAARISEPYPAASGTRIKQIKDAGSVAYRSKIGQHASDRRRRAAPVLVPLEQRDALDVVGLREHVDGADAAERPAGLDEFGRVRGERGWVAGDVDDAGRRG